MRPSLDRRGYVAELCRTIFRDSTIGPDDVFYTTRRSDMEAGWYRVPTDPTAPVVRIGGSVAACERRANATAPQDPIPESDVEFLRRLADNDYMIDQHYLDDGKRLLALALKLETQP